MLSSAELSIICNLLYYYPPTTVTLEFVTVSSKQVPSMTPINVGVGVTSCCKCLHADPADMLATVGASHVVTAAVLFYRCRTAWAQLPVGSVLIKPHCHSVIGIASKSLINVACESLVIGHLVKTHAKTL
jgi:hypothetical protein